MRIETRATLASNGATVDRILLICETPLECQFLDFLGQPGDKVTGELRLSDGYGDFYLALPIKGHEL
jgi:hypothetical protein